MLSKRYESTGVDRLHVHSEIHWSTSSNTHQVVEIQIETSTKMYTPFLIRFNLQLEPIENNGKCVVFICSVVFSCSPKGRSEMFHIRKMDNHRV